MTEKKVFFQAGDVKIEGLLHDAPGDKGVVVTHPHPLYGGDMNNNVVEAIAEAYQEKGYATLRFNFRGMGQSEGTHDNGVGEQEDVRAALAYLGDMGKTSIDLAGYSFGAWVNACGLPGFEQARRLIMVSPPVSFLDFSFLEYNEKIQLVIGASRDDIGPPYSIKKMLRVWNPEARFSVIDGSDHFYWGRNGGIKRIIHEFLEEKD
jgi:alpha/beta superfamily hydrolase